MEIGHLRYFYAVAKHGGFTPAAKALRVSQPSLSKFVKQIEEDQGIRLFDRSTRSVRLTETGKRYLETCEAIFREFDGLHRISELHKSQVIGDASFGASDNLCNYALPGILKEFTSAYPGVLIKLSSGTSDFIKGEIDSGRADFGIFYTEASESVYDVQKIAFVEFVIVAKGDLVGSRRDVGLERLQELGYIGSRTSDYSNPYPALRMLHSLGVKPRIAMETNIQETQKRLALEGWGYTLVPRFMVESELRSRKLVQIRTSKLLGSDLFYVTKRNRMPAKPAAVLSEFIVSALSAKFSRFRNRG